METKAWAIQIVLMTCLASVVVTLKDVTKLEYIPGKDTQELSCFNTSGPVSLRFAWPGNLTEQGTAPDSIYHDVRGHGEIWLVIWSSTTPGNFLLHAPENASNTTDPLYVRCVDDVTRNIDHVILLYRHRDRSSSLQFDKLFAVHENLTEPQPLFQIAVNSSYKATLNCHQEPAGPMEFCEWNHSKGLDIQHVISPKITLAEGLHGDDVLPLHDGLYTCVCKWNQKAPKKPTAAFNVTISRDVIVKSTLTYEVVPLVEKTEQTTSTDGAPPTTTQTTPPVKETNKGATVKIVPRQTVELSNPESQVKAAETKDPKKEESLTENHDSQENLVVFLAVVAATFFLTTVALVGYINRSRIKNFCRIKGSGGDLENQQGGNDIKLEVTSNERDYTRPTEDVERGDVNERRPMIQQD